MAVTDYIGKKQISNKIMTAGARWIFAALLTAGAIFLYTQVHSAPERVFWDMVGNNLATRGLTRQTSQRVGGSSTENTSQTTYGAFPSIHVVKKLTDASTVPTTRLSLEGIGTPTDDYQRYSLIDRPAEPKKQKADYSKIYNTWIRTGLGKSSSQDTASPQLFGQTLFGAMVFGNLPPVERADLVSYIRTHNVYNIDFSKVIRKTDGARKVYLYPATISLSAYAGAVKMYAKDLGLPAADQINASDYKPTDRLKVDITVDVSSRQITKIVYKDSGEEETYSGYGLAPEVTLPTKTVNSKNFQSALNSVSR